VQAGREPGTVNSIDGKMLRRLHGHLSPSAAVPAGTAAEADPSALAPYALKKLHPSFGARLSNVDIANIKTMTPEQWDFIQAAFDEYGVLVMGGQGDDLPPKALSELACRFHRSDPTEIGLPAECGPQFGKKPKRPKGGGPGGAWGGVPKHPEISILGINQGW
jgi:hypothetical protein